MSETKTIEYHGVTFIFLGDQLITMDATSGFNYSNGQRHISINGVVLNIESEGLYDVIRNLKERERRKEREESVHVAAQEATYHFSQIAGTEPSLEDQVNEHDTKKEGFNPALPFELLTDHGTWVSGGDEVYIGVNPVNNDHIVYRASMDDDSCFGYIGYKGVRNIKKPSFDVGTPVWFRPDWTDKSLWLFGTTTADGKFIDCQGSPASFGPVRPFFINGQATHPPFND